MNIFRIKLPAILLLASTVSVWAATNAVPVHPPLRAGDSKSYPHTGEPPLPSGLKPLFDIRMRDPSICPGPDGIYYLTGTTGTNIWVANEGIEIWKSPDLKNWTPLGMVWSIERDGSWQKQWTVKNGNRRRAVWAPEIHWLKGNFYIAYCITGLGTGLLRSTTGKPEGPYVSVNRPDAPLTPGIDASLFEDDDGKVYFVHGSGFLARLKDDLSGLAEEPVRLRCDPGDPDIEHHHPQRPCPPSEYDHVGFEGAFLFKANGRYYLSCAERYYERYHCMTAESETLRGSYRARYVSVPEAGHNVFFKDAQGWWWSTIFGNDDDAPFHERPGILRIEFDRNGHIRPLVNQPGQTPKPVVMSPATIIRTAFAAFTLALVLPVRTVAADTTTNLSLSGNPSKLRYETVTREVKLKQGDSLTWNGR